MAEYEIEVFKGVNAKVSTYYQPFEKQTHDYPGCPEEHEIEEVIVNGVDIAEHLTEEFLASIIKDIEDDNEPDWDSIAESRQESLDASYISRYGEP